MDEPFEHVVRRHGATVLRVCRSVVGHHDAQDAWAETFLAALRAWPALDAGANVEAWLVTIARRKALDTVRGSARRAVPVDVLPEAGERVDEADGVADGLDLWAALGALPERQRRAVALHHLGGLPYPEVAEVLGGTPAAARRAGADGIATLRRTYARWDDEGEPR
ncbi:sigma-70 family RNA polymerase sigma factor [Cellulomonas sp. DKR-3]|uniref:Sigma-70 family RNA polymerase sigma factor n=1 Tax=Cellulomonas fulva TaxID=2835530 RepID=A0ABS5U114_9CELL|nr:sigma-70 family RNA polymerase sigma factor [Cellulomonas fulva]MBT0995098.1 sigma-70 family RNA polymerase sigma factor [Cellulomonas fulva]